MCVCVCVWYCSAVFHKCSALLAGSFFKIIPLGWRHQNLGYLCFLAESGGGGGVGSDYKNAFLAHMVPEGICIE